MIKHIHSSGRYDRPASALKAALEEYAEHANVITLTETHRRRKSTLAMPGWTVVKFPGPGQGDPAILVRTDEVKVLKYWSQQLTKYEQRRGSGGPPPAHALTALCEHRGKRFLLTVAHLPSHVQQNWFARYYYRVMVWRSAVRGWKRHIRNLRRKSGVKKVAYVADWNLDFKKPAFRALMKTRFPMLKLTWRAMPSDGTHYSRVIDATVTNLRIRKPARLFPDDPSSDHRPYIEQLGL